MWDTAVCIPHSLSLFYHHASLVPKLLGLFLVVVGGLALNMCWHVCICCWLPAMISNYFIHIKTEAMSHCVVILKKDFTALILSTMILCVDYFSIVVLSDILNFIYFLVLVSLGCILLFRNLIYVDMKDCWSCFILKMSSLKSMCINFRTTKYIVSWQLQRIAASIW